MLHLFYNVGFFLHIDMGKQLFSPVLLNFFFKKFFLAVGDGRMGYAEEAPYDAIHVGAAAPVVPQAVSLYVLCVCFCNILAVENALHTSICKILGSLHSWEYQWAVWYYCMVWGFCLCYNWASCWFDKAVCSNNSALNKPILKLHVCNPLLQQHTGAFYLIIRVYQTLSYKI